MNVLQRGATVLTAALLGISGGATAHAAESEETAVVGPLLNFFEFGASVGAPVFCGTTTATLGSVFQEAGASEQGNLAVDGINSQCAEFSVQGTEWVRQGKQAQAPLAPAVNPALSPAIAQMATAVTGFGDDFGPALSPFGQTVAGSGNTIAFFQGTPPPPSAAMSR